MRKIFIALLVVAAVFAHSSAVSSEEERHGGHEQHEAGEIRLSDDIKAVLSQEMLLIEEGMAALVHEIAYGNWDKIAAIAEKMERSYIMKQKLSTRQFEELHHKLPPGFLEMDHAFHKTAGMLAHVAKERHGDLVVFYFYKLADGCMTCHAKYAKDAFPNFGSQQTHKRHEH